MRSWRGAASLLRWWAVVSHVLVWGRGVRCGMVVVGFVVAFPSGAGPPCPGLVAWVVARGWSSDGVRQPHAVSRSSLWCVSVRGPCGVVVVWGSCSPGAGCVESEFRNQGGACVVLGGVGPPVSGPSGAGSAVYGPRASCHVCGVRELVGRGILGVLWSQCGLSGW